MFKRSRKHVTAFLLAACLPAGSLLSQYDYPDALNKAVAFFDANKCGPNAGSNNVFSWRGACHTTDGSGVGRDLSGGFHDAGDHVKFGLPQAFSASTLGWALYEHPEAFERAGAKQKMLSTLKHFTDYFIKCHPNSTTFYYQVGDGDSDHAYWGPPETQTTARPTVVATPSSPASDICGQTAAALALMSLNYRDTNAAYADTCLNAALSIYELGVEHVGRGNDGTNTGKFYKSGSHYDDLSWGGIWIAIASNDNSYLEPIDAWLDIPNDYGNDNYNKRWAPAWDDVTVYVLLKMHELTGVAKYRDGVISLLKYYRDDLRRTPGGLPYLDAWGVLRYASCVAGVGYLAAEKLAYDGYKETADATIDYILGSNPRNSSYLTGWGVNPPQHPHHRANQPDFYYPNTGFTYGLVGGLVGGPKNDDSFTDEVAEYQRTEVGLDYNASFVLGLSGKIAQGGSTPIEQLSISASALSAPANGGSFSLAVTSNLGWSATDNRSWISLSPSSGSNNGTVTVTVSPNTGTSGRTGALTFTGGSLTRSVSVTQGGVAANQAPVANAGPDISVTDTNLDGQENVSLNGSASSDDQGVTSYVWTEGSQQIATGVNPSVSLSVGAHTIVLTVSDASGLTSTDAVVVSVAVGSSGGSGSATPISLPFEHNGAGEFYWFTTGAISRINSWHADSVTINGVSITNSYLSARQLPDRVDGGYYIRFSGSKRYSHFEAK